MGMMGLLLSSVDGTRHMEMLKNFCAVVGFEKNLLVGSPDTHHTEFVDFFELLTGLARRRHTAVKLPTHIKMTD